MIDIHGLCTRVLLVALLFGCGVVRADEWDATQPRGANLRQIAFDTDEGTWMSVSLSPDGQWIAFDLLGHIYRVPAAGGTAQCLTADSGIALNLHPRYSPDGTQIAFVSDRGGQDNLWVMSADGSQPRAIFQDQDVRVVEPAWMPDGRSILVTQRQKTAYGFYRLDDAIWRYAADGSGGRELVGRGDRAPSPERFSGNPRFQWPAASPDGKYVYFNSAAFDGTNRQIRRLNLQSGRVQDVTESKLGYPSCCGRPAYPERLGEAAPEISPDGRWLSFVRKIPGGVMRYRDKEYIGRSALWLRDLSTGDERILLDPVEADLIEGHPSWTLRVLPGYSWAHDSRSIVIAQGGKLRRVWIADGRVQTIPFTVHVQRTISEMARGRVAMQDASFEAREIRWPAASPDGTRLAFEAAGRIWIKKLPDGVPRRALVNNRDEDIERTPAWSPDGKSLALVTAGADGRGHVWRVDAASGRGVRISSAAAHYAFPVFSGDGRTLYVNRWPPALTPTLSTPQWELVRFPAKGGDATVVTSTGVLVAGGSARNRVYFAEPSPDLQRSIISSVDETGADRRQHLSIAGPVSEFAVSPDGAAIAFRRSRQIYLAPVPSEGAAPTMLDVSAASDANTWRRVSETAGMRPHWLTSSRIGYFVGSRHFVYDLTSGTTAQADIGLHVPRRTGRGSIALQGARLITMVGNSVIEKGTIVVKDARITCVGECDVRGVDRVIDVSGKTIMPGWVGTHEHHQNSDPHGFIPKQRGDSAVYLAYGITTTFDPFTSDDAFAIGEMTAAGAIVGPRSFTSGAGLSCDWDPRIYARSQSDDMPRIDSYEDARRLVQANVAQGAISIKDYKQCTRTQREMLATAAREAGVSITTENGDLFYILGEIMNGHTGWEHPIEHEPIYRDVATFIGQAKAHYSADLILSNYPHGDAFEYWLGQNDLWQDEKAARWLPWQKLAVRRSFVKKPLREYAFPILAEGAADIARAGGLPTIGAHGEQHGLGSHWEVWTMAMATPPLEALRYATYNGAHFLGLETDLGSLETGKLADLVVLNSNPLEDIHNTLDNAYVMVAGRLFETATLTQVWPTQRPYGLRPWVNDDIRRRDVRAIEGGADDDVPTSQ